VIPKVKVHWYSSDRGENGKKIAIKSAVFDTVTLVPSADFTEELVWEFWAKDRLRYSVVNPARKAKASGETEAEYLARVEEEYSTFVAGLSDLKNPVFTIEPPTGKRGRESDPTKGLVKNAKAMKAKGMSKQDIIAMLMAMIPDDGEEFDLDDED